MRWTLKNPDLKRQHMQGTILEKLNTINDVSLESLSEFLSPTTSSLNSPTLLHNIEAASDRTLRAITEKARICISGDVDVDGVTSLTITYQYLKTRTDNVYYVYHQRSRGHGIVHQLNMIDDHTDLLIILDSSSNDVESCEMLHNRGIDIIIIDHHQIDQVNDHALIVNPHHPDDTSPNKELSTSALCYKFVQVLDNYGPAADRNIDLAGVGLHADRMCMRSMENRFFVSEALKNIQNPGLIAILKVAGRWGKAHGNTATDIAFTLAPFINSAARLDRIELAIDLLNCVDGTRCMEMARVIQGMNQTRKEIMAEHVRSLQTQINPINSVHLLVDESGTISKGFAGVVAAEIQEQTHRSVIYLNKSDNILSGSYRSSFDMKSLLETIPSIQHVGGHPQAGGCSLPSDQLENTQSFLNKNVSAPEPTLVYDLELDADIFLTSFLDITLFNRICGKNIEEPVFLFKNVHVCSKFLMGKDKEHLKIRGRLPGAVHQIDILKFKVSPTYSAQICRGDYIDVLGTASLNEWNNRVVKQILMKDYRRADTSISGM